MTGSLWQRLLCGGPAVRAPAPGLAPSSPARTGPAHHGSHGTDNVHAKQGRSTGPLDSGRRGRGEGRQLAVY